MKLGAVAKSWKRRHFRLVEGDLKYFDGKKEKGSIRVPVMFILARSMMGTHTHVTHRVPPSSHLWRARWVSFCLPLTHTHTRYPAPTHPTTTHISARKHFSYCPQDVVVICSVNIPASTCECLILTHGRLRTNNTRAHTHMPARTLFLAGLRPVGRTRTYLMEASDVVERCDEPASPNCIRELLRHPPQLLEKRGFGTSLLPTQLMVQCAFLSLCRASVSLPGGQHSTIKHGFRDHTVLVFRGHGRRLVVRGSCGWCFTSTHACTSLHMRHYSHHKHSHPTAPTSSHVV